MKLIELHILQSFSVSCLNRDNVGVPKTAISAAPRAWGWPPWSARLQRGQLLHTKNSQDLGELLPQCLAMLHSKIAERVMIDHL
jgi:hypothetical protein